MGMGEKKEKKKSFSSKLVGKSDPSMVLLLKKYLHKRN